MSFIGLAQEVQISGKNQWYGTACASKRVISNEVISNETTRSLARPVLYRVRLLDILAKALFIRHSSIWLSQVSPGKFPK